VSATAVELTRGMDFRLRQYRREVFQRFYTFHLRYRTHPGCVYFLLPALAEARGWDGEQRAWAAWINGNTQNPVTTWLLMRAGDRPARADQMLAYWREHYRSLDWDTDRRYHKARFADATAAYLDATRGGQVRYWSAAGRGGWGGMWRAATALATMGRLSAWSYLEYVRLLVDPTLPDADTLLLADRAGSRSHRNGLCRVLGLDELDWHDSNPRFDGHYPPEVVRHLEAEAGRLVTEAARRNPGEAHVGYLTLESALCTYKSWHRPRRRYPNVYADMLHDRLHRAERAWPGVDFGVFWHARRDTLPTHLRLENCPTDPGCVPEKQDHYRLTGEVIMMQRDWPCFANSLNDKIDAGAFGRRR